MKHVMLAVALVLLAIVGLIGCEKSAQPVTGTAPVSDDAPDLQSLQAASWPHCSDVAPSPLVSVAVGTQSLEFWPYTASDLTGTPKDPINLVFFGKADPRDIRAALLSLDGDRSSLGMPPMPPFNSTWQDDIEGDIQATYASGCRWTPGAIQLVCGDYSSIRFHLRLFRVGKWTVGGGHFEVLVPGTTTHQVLSWELAEQFVMGDLMRSGLLDPTTPMIPTGQLNESPFRTIPAIIYNGLPMELRGLIGGPLGNVTEDVPIANDGYTAVLNLASRVDGSPLSSHNSFVVQFDQVVPKPFCSSGPYDYVYVSGPITLTQTIEFTKRGEYRASFFAEGELSVTPVDPTTGQPIAEPFSARVREFHNAELGRVSASGSSLRYQDLHPFGTPGSGWFFERFRVGSSWGNGYQLIVRCEPSQTTSPSEIASSGSIEIDGNESARAIVGNE
jgi:hypothetical protein